MEILGIIPARYASTRFPGKPLVSIQGKTMIQRVYEQASKAKLTQVLVATDDERIMAEVQRFGGEAVLTANHHQSGTDRCFEAYTGFNVPHDGIINIQGDEPFIQPEQINLLVACLENPATQLATLVKPIESAAELFNPNSPKVVLNQHHEAIYFSRQPIPYLRGAEESTWPDKHLYYKHIGIYGYRADILEQITQLPPSALEKAESLEQLRWLENGYKIATAVTYLETFGIDTPEDLERAIQSRLH
ncbi:3-deoxy-manno-octulosonate cytidylyltransferase [Adhaeribacter pallidiroseus]|uniref:3-deoxy-manno-octulosonate cytidylyltransferase n=1 Tax=Adhaeribacter pallidiroseus TaxID=2072847 RepID=A0A369QMG1_9BACT|nr:3-deoxy-manno-octulosonate cytidylyltransferase [Adhaeribacter pallidiroseus]RDC64396.1 3-deoxy-manno-octulosonate cytidylyltransferase [Adhaeribacter pallidiroseus]